MLKLAARCSFLEGRAKFDLKNPGFALNHASKNYFENENVCACREPIVKKDTYT